MVDALMLGLALFESDESDRFGVCCVFTLSGTSGTVTQNSTYIQNPGYPSSYGTSSAVQYTVNKCSSGQWFVSRFKMAVSFCHWLCHGLVKMHQSCHSNKEVVKRGFLAKQNMP